MRVTLKPYPEYKDSGVSWLGEIPRHWKAVRLKQVAQVGPSKSEAKELLGVNPEVVFLPMERVGTDGRVSVREMRPMSLLWNGFTYFRRLDVLVAKITPCFENGKGACLSTLPTELGFGSTEFIVLRAINSITPQYLYRVSTLPEFRARGADAMTGAAGQQRLPPNFVKNFVCGLPPLKEQDAITAFLAHFDHRINHLIRAKRRLIDLLNEQKQAIIHRAVTRGLDPNVPLKDSGVEWLGEVPAHWEVRRLKYWLKTNRATLPETTDPDYEFNYLDIGSVGTGRLTAPPERTRFATSPSRARRIVNLGDTIVSTVRTYLKAVWHVEESVHDLIASTGFAVFTPQLGTVPKFVSYLAQSDFFTNRVAAESVGISYPAIVETKLGTFKISIPPLPEQIAIVKYLDKSTADIDTAIARARRQIDLLREYRTRLIADVVMGKLDVRGVALPTLDASETMDDLDEESAFQKMEDTEEMANGDTR